MKLKEYVDIFQKGKDYSWQAFWLMFGTFLDEFYALKDTKMFEEEPIYNKNITIEMRSFIAASVDHLCDLENLKYPKWTKDLKYVLKEPFFPSGLKGPIRAVMLIESPIAYKVRNIYVLNNVLTRV